MQEKTFKFGDLVQINSTQDYGLLICNDTVNKSFFYINIFSEDEIEPRWISSKEFLLVEEKNDEIEKRTLA